MYSWKNFVLSHLTERRPYLQIDIQALEYLGNFTTPGAILVEIADLV